MTNEELLALLRTAPASAAPSEREDVEAVIRDLERFSQGTPVSATVHPDKPARFKAARMVAGKIVLE
jgi:hypothetical protein